uniref:Uncharacterized protein n=1 Tax=Glossina palpalis gambiensis TaxID=67801 RepID=A0A1B0BTT9_9MUSC
MAISPPKQIQTNTLKRTTEVRTASTMPLTTGNIAAKAETTRSDFPRPKHVTQGRVRHATAKPARAYKESQSVATEPKSKNAIRAKIPITGSAHVPTNTKKSTIDKCKSITVGNTLPRTTDVRTAKTMPLTTGNKTAKAATTSSDIPEPKYGHKVRSTRAFKDLQSVITREDTTIAITASRKTNKNKKDKKAKADKDNANSHKNNINNRRLCLHHRPRQGQFNELASPSPNTFYGTSTNMEQASDASKQTDKWLPAARG